MSEGKTRLLPVITGLFVGVLILSNILAAKMVRMGPFVFDGGTLLFPLSYIFGDVLTEVYGYKESRKVIWTGLAMLVLMSLNIWLIGALPAAEPNVLEARQRQANSCALALTVREAMGDTSGASMPVP